MSVRILKLLALATVFGTCGLSHAQDLVGANGTIKRYLAGKGRPGPGELTPPELAEALSRMEPKAAGEKWASTYLRNSTKRRGDQSRGFDFYEDEMSALPGPETWPSIDAWYVSNHAPLPYQALSSYLVGDRSRLRKLIFELAKTKSSQVNEVMLKFGVAWADREMVTAGVHREVEQINEKIKALGEKRDGWEPQLHIPALSNTFGKEFATETIKYGLEKTKSIVLVSGQADYEIAVGLGRKSAASYPIARYELIQTFDAGDLYPVIEKQFPKADSIAKARALAFHTQWKIIEGKSDIVWSNLDVLERDGFSTLRYPTAVIYGLRGDFDARMCDPSVARRVIPLLEKQLLVNPDSRDLNMCARMSSSLGLRKAMVPTLERLLALKPTSENENLRDSAASNLREILSAELTDSQYAELALQHFRKGLMSASTCLDVGRLLHRQDLVKAALGAQKPKYGNAGARLADPDDVSDLEKAFIEGKDEDSAQTLLFGYSKLGRYQDVIDLLDRFSDWREPDLKDLTFDGDEGSVQYVAAKAFIKVGDADLGVRILRQSMRSRSESLKAYDLFVQAVGDDVAMAEFRQAAAEAPMSPMPHLAMAKILLRMGKAQEAEVELKRAKDIDPLFSDDPIPSLTIQEAIQLALGKTTQAQDTRAMIESIKLSKQADTYLQVGLTKTGLQYLRKAIAANSNVFYPHARLANELYEQGELDEARVQYRQAFRTMPASHGQNSGPSYLVEDRLLRTKFSQDIAYEVFIELLKNDPQNPRINYQLGSLLRLQGHDAEAAKYLERAVELDPNYCVALQELAWSDQLSSSQRALYLRRHLLLGSRRQTWGYRGEENPDLEPRDFYDLFKKTATDPSQFEPLYPLAETIKARSANGYSSERQNAIERLPGNQLASSELMRTLQGLLKEVDEDNE